MRNYIFSIVAAAIICAVSRSLIDKKTSTGQIIRLLTGILMTVTVIVPLGTITFDRVSDYMNSLSIEADTYVHDGISSAERQVSAIIKSQTEAYILDKAKSMDIDISVEVELDAGNNQIPCGVMIKGALSPYGKEVLSNYIEETLGVPKENQRWT